MTQSWISQFWVVMYNGNIDTVWHTELWPKRWNVSKRLINIAGFYHVIIWIQTFLIIPEQNLRLLLMRNSKHLFTKNREEKNSFEEEEKAPELGNLLLFFR